MRKNNGLKFIVDSMLGRLATLLRIFGYDTTYVAKNERKNITLKSLKENRILLTRDTRLSAKRAWKLLFIKSEHLKDQVSQLIKDLRIEFSENSLFTVCTLCNSPLRPIKKSAVAGRIPVYVFETHETFSYCDTCDKIYWEGTHRSLLEKDLHTLIHGNDN